MKGFFRKAATIRALGPVNVARVGLYRLGLRAGLHPVLRVKADVPSGPFFGSARPAPASAEPRADWRDEGVWFSHHRFALPEIPDWHANPFRPGARADDRLPWNKIPDFDPELGDVKTVWEPSRFDWLLAMATRASWGDQSELDRLNTWLDDWAQRNPPYLGTNWKCGQEASIRVMHLAAAALILGGWDEPESGLRDLVRLHLRRIAPTIGYAIGQANNHGTSEAAALFIGGVWLDDAEGAKWARIGRRWLEDRAQKLITPDGMFSQYSTVYHRVMLDTYCLAEVWRKRFHLPPFSARLNDRLVAATQWLATLTNATSGDAPNFGANDGAQLMRLSNSGYRDFRPTVQLAANLFANGRALAGVGPWDQPAIWLGVAEDRDMMPETPSRTFDDGGLHALRRGDVLALLRYPRFRFRPSQADALHLDLWVGENNLLRDAGSYSYASVEGVELAGTAAHNTVAFDGRDQMPRLGRFLFGDWLKARNVAMVSSSEGSVSAGAGYRDCRGAEHHRTVRLADNSLVCSDRLQGSFVKAVLRWRLAPGDWRLTGDTLACGAITMRITADCPLVFRLSDGQESRHYLDLTSLPVLEVEVSAPCRLTTEIHF